MTNIGQMIMIANSPNDERLTGKQIGKIMIGACGDSNLDLMW